VYALEGSTFSLYPSFWRTDGCRAHFIVWRSNLYMMGRQRFAPTVDSSLLENLKRTVGNQFVTAEVLAERLNEDAWLVAIGCDELVEQRAFEARTVEGAKLFRLATPTRQTSRFDRRI
jgi:hypothetical protein